MALPTPATTQTTATVLIAVKALLESTLLTTELATQQAALRTQSGDATLSLPRPSSFYIGDPEFAETNGPLCPGVVVYAEASTVPQPDVTGDTYQVESTICVMVVMATQDMVAFAEQGMYLAIHAYAHAIAMVMQTHLMSPTYGNTAGIYDCLPLDFVTSPPPIRVEGGWALRYTQSRFTVRWQTKQPAPAQP